MTLACTIDSTGIYAPDYSDIFAELQAAYWSIYGSDANLDDDSQDGQFLAIFANAINDSNQATIAAYNSYSPNGAQGSGLSSLAKLVGVRRQSASYSTDTLTVSGTSGTAITGGQVGDNQGQGTVWNLPSPVTIPESGEIEVTITATALGDTTFAPGDIDQILTPTLGWQSAVNVGPAVAGAPVQDDAELREQISNSTAGPASTVLESIWSAVESVGGVQRSYVYENDTDDNDANGQGPHSIYAVVLGGGVQDIVDAIGGTKSPGTTTLGTTSGTYVDENGVPDVISYYQLDEITIDVVVNITELSGYTSAAAAAIQQAVAQYISGLAIGGDSYLNKLWSPANLSGDAATTGTGLSQTQLDALSATYNVTSILQAPSPNEPEAQDVDIAFDQAAVCLTTNVTVNATS